MYVKLLPHPKPKVPFYKKKKTSTKNAILMMSDRATFVNHLSFIISIPMLVADVDVAVDVNVNADRAYHYVG